MGMPKVGQTEDGHSFIGGDPSKQENWKAIGAVEDGHVFKGGDPSKAESWASVNQSTTPQTSALETGIESFGNQAAFGYLPQIQAATEPLVQGAMGLFGDNTDEKLRAQGFNIQEAAPTTYLQRRDENIARQQLQAKENPTTAMISGLAGGLTTGLATGGALGALGLGGRAASFGGRLAQAAGTGAVTGAIRNPGDTQGEVSPFQPQDRLKNAALDATIGTVLQGGLEGVGKAGKLVKDSEVIAKSFAELKALKASGLMLKSARKIFGNQKANEIGRAALDEKIVQAGDTIQDIAEKARDAQSKIGQELGDIYDQADNLIQSKVGSELSVPGGPTLKSAKEQGFDVTAMADKFLSDIKTKYKGLAGGSDVVKKLESILGDVRDNPISNFSRLKEIRQSIDDQIDFSVANAEMAPIQTELRNLRNKFQDQVKIGLQVLDEQNGTKLADQFVKTNKRFSNVAELTAIAEDKAKREISNNVLGLRETITGSIGSGIGTAVLGPGMGTVIGGAAGVGASQFARKYATPVVAAAAEKAANILSKNPKALGAFSEALISASKVSPQKYITTVAQMMSNPEFKKAIDSNTNKFQRSGQ